MAITAGRLESMNNRAWLTVTSYGADASGTTDAAPAIQTALDEARDRGGAQVLVPPGVYLLGATLRVYANTRLSCMAGAELRRIHGGTMLLNGDGSQAYGGYTGHGNIWIEGGLWNMQGTVPGLTSSAMCMSFGHATDITVEDAEILDVPGYHAIELNSTLHGLVRNCRFRGYIDPDGTRTFSEAVQLDLAKSSSVFGGFGPYDHTPCEDILLTGCHFGDSDTEGTTAWPRGIGSHSATIGRWHRRIRVSDNAFEGLLQFAVSAYNWEDVTVVGNTFNRCGSGVRLRSVIKSDPEDTKDVDGNQTGESQVMRNIAVSGNTFREGGGYDNVIVVQGEASTGTVLNVAVTGNAIDGSSGNQSGIRLNYASRVTVADNIVANVDNTGISTENQNNTVISGNVIWNASDHGVTMVSSVNSNIIGNQIRDPGDTGIFVNGPGSDIQIRDNFIDGPNQANTGSQAIRFSTSAVVGIAISGNKCRPGGSATPGTAALSISSANSGVHRYGNDFRGSWNGTAIQDSSNAPETSATDIS
ncbi:NosD domain-containing protein [Streptomyces sp. NPDC007025]|uniref:NosD domain-containing protein n=1 Tax=Streptomyces sp. NPDC007025 TaxID=3364771 RepID=UPI0036C65822